MTESLPSLSEPAAVEPAWHRVHHLDDLLDLVQEHLGEAAREALALRWDDLGEALDTCGDEPSVRFWPAQGWFETSTVMPDPDAEETKPMATSAEEKDLERVGGRFIVGTSEEQVNAVLREYGNRLYLWVDTYRHGMVDHAVSGTRYTSGFDVSSGTALFVPADDQQNEYRRLRKTLPALEARRLFVDRANAALERFTNWSNGEIYSTEVRLFDRLGQPLAQEQDYGVLGARHTDASIDGLSSGLRARRLRQDLDAIAPSTPTQQDPAVAARRPAPGR